VEEEELEEREEKREEGHISYASYKLYINKMGYLNCFLIFLSMFMMQFGLNFYDLWLKYYVNQTPIFILDNFETSLLFISGVSLLFTLFRAFQFAIGNLKAAKGVFVYLMRKILYTDIKFFEKNEIGGIINRLSGDT
jgi:ABC-type multidrug transport system fused ATPase/permease subunit